MLRMAALLFSNLLFSGVVVANPDTAASELKLNDVQVIGSHNSYRPVPPEKILTYLAKVKPKYRTALNYGHLPLKDQLDHGVRQIELDIFADPEGGHFLEPYGERMAPGGVDRAVAATSGFKVMHVPGLDYRSTCAAFKTCLLEVREWSVSHPGHIPIFITIDAKDEPTGFPKSTDPLKLSAKLLDDLDAEIRSIFPDDSLITPDDVRGAHASLREAVLADAWPRLESARGKIMFIFDVRASTANQYREGHPSLEGRAMFSLYAASEPEAAVMIFQDPLPEKNKIKDLVTQGFLVRTRSDSGTVEARNRDVRKLRAAIDSGAQMISTDFYPGAPDPQHLKFQVTLPGGVMFWCNPVRQGSGCDLEE
jgi:hypothetical protein